MRARSDESRCSADRQPLKDGTGARCMLTRQPGSAYCQIHTPKCPAKLAYRDMSDIGPARVCNAKAVTPAGFCRRHDPETMPKRGKDGRILAKHPKTCAVCKWEWDAYCRANSHAVAKPPCPCGAICSLCSRPDSPYAPGNTARQS